MLVASLIWVQNLWPSKNCLWLASFPGRSHFLYLITCSMQIRRGRPGRSGHACVVMSGRQRADTWGVVPNEESQNPSLYYQSVQHQYCSSFTTTRMFWHKKGIITVRYCPPCVYPFLPDIIAHNQISHYWRWERHENKASGDHTAHTAVTVANIHPNCDFFVFVRHAHVTPTSKVYMTPITA